MTGKRWRKRLGNGSKSGGMRVPAGSRQEEEEGRRREGGGGGAFVEV